MRQKAISYETTETSISTQKREREREREREKDSERRFFTPTQLFFYNSYSGQIFCRLNNFWTDMFAVCTKPLRLQVLASCTEICNFHHKLKFSSKTHMQTKFFADSTFVGPTFSRFVPKKREKKTVF